MKTVSELHSEAKLILGEALFNEAMAMDIKGVIAHFLTNLVEVERSTNAFAKQTRGERLG